MGVPSAQAALHQNVQGGARRATPTARWRSGLRHRWPYPAPITLSHARRRWHDRPCMMSAHEVAMNGNDPASGSDVARS